jgi:hypothetical protein
MGGENERRRGSEVVKGVWDAVGLIPSCRKDCIFNATFVILRSCYSATTTCYFTRLIVHLMKRMEGMKLL